MHHFMGHTLKLIVLISLTFASCADGSHKGTTFIKSSQGDTTLKTDTTHRTLTASTTNSPTNDTLIIDRKAAVFIEPDSLQIEKRKKQVGEENFYTGADDYLFYMNTAHEFLDSVKLTTLSAKDKMFIKFIRSDKTQEVIKLDKLDELWSIYFFDPMKKAKQVDMTIIDEEYKSYFK
jgi:hypothetical protein